MFFCSPIVGLLFSNIANSAIYIVDHEHILTLARLEQNVKLQEEIENQEGASHDAVKKLLRKYEKFRVITHFAPDYIDRYLYKCVSIDIFRIFL